MEVRESPFLKEYRVQSLKILARKHPDIAKSKMKPIVDKMIMDRFMNPDAEIDNTYTHEHKDTKLLSVLDWCIDRKPIIAGNGTFFKQHKGSKNPNAKMVRGFLSNRARIKGEMFAVEDENSRPYKMKDLFQGNEKRLANSYYGGQGSKTSAFYNKWTAPSTTLSAQSIISTCETTFEAFLADTFTFVDINECLFWIENVLKDEDSKVDDWVKRVTVEQCYNRLAPVVIGITEDERVFLYEYLESLTKDEITRLYWKNNLIAFTDAHENVKELHHKIFKNIHTYEYMQSDDDMDIVPKKYKERVRSAKKPRKEWENIVDHEKFYDPNNVPDSIKKELNELKDIYMKYVYQRYIYMDHIYKLKNFNRNVVTVIDTDSNILSLDTWMEYCLKKLKRGTYLRDNWDNVFIAINTMCYIITAVVTNVLDYYGLCSNVDDEHRPMLSMKNEFFFANLVLAKVKKRYLSKVILREGHKLKKPKFNVTGFDFKKATTSDDATNFFMHMVKDLILGPDEVNLREIMMELQRFRKEVKDSLLAGERKYLPTGSAKEVEAYDEPKSEQSLRAVFAWNALYPDRALELPTKLSILKTTIYKLSDVQELERSDPELFQRIEEQIFNDRTGFFVRTTKSGKVNCEGLSVIGIPLYEKIPDWIIPHIDFKTTVNSVLSPFKSVTETFNLPSIEEGPTGRKTTGFSGIIRI